MGHEELQQAVFGRAHFGWLAINGHAVADRIEQQATDFDRGFTVARAGATQHGL
ncbi:hypothetical protein D3C78_1800310 [compost metagenome]